jgi:hypothetical protein
MINKNEVLDKSFQFAKEVVAIVILIKQHDIR